MSNPAVQRVQTAKRDELVLNAMRPLIGEAAFCVLKLVIAHDGSLGAALSASIAARGDVIGLQALLDGKRAAQ